MTFVFEAKIIARGFMNINELVQNVESQIEYLGSMDPVSTIIFTHSHAIKDETTAIFYVDKRLALKFGDEPFEQVLQEEMTHSWEAAYGDEDPPKAPFLITRISQ